MGMGGVGMVWVCLEGVGRRRYSKGDIGVGVGV